MNAVEVYHTYIALKLHFNNPDYDYVKFSGKVKASFDAFEKRPDKYHFAKLAKHKDPKGYLLANFVDGDLKWGGDVLTDKSDQIYAKWVKRQQSITYVVTQELDSVADDILDYCKPKNGQHPKLLELHRFGKLSIETLVYLNQFLHIFKIWDKKITDDIIWPVIKMRCVKYQALLVHDTTKIEKKIREIAQTAVNG